MYTPTEINNTNVDNRLLPQAFFTLNNFAHKAIFKGMNEPETGVHYVWQALSDLTLYFTHWLTKHKPYNLGKVSPKAYLINPEQIFIGEGSVIEAGAYIAGPAIIGRGCVIRHGAYIRGDVILGDEVVVGHASEVKHSILLNRSHAPHFAYVGDSILGNEVNLGAGTKLSNLTVVSTKNPKTGKRPSVLISIGGRDFDTKLAKMGAILGDGVQTGCNCVLNPGCIVGQRTLIYPNTSLRKGYYEPRKVIKLRQSLETADLIQEFE